MTVNEYIGVLDETTGKIIPKKSRVREDNLIEADDLEGRRFGGPYPLKDLSERIGLRGGDLFWYYSHPDGDKILACAIAQALSRGPFSSVEDTADGCLIMEMLGIDSGFSSPRMSEFTNTLEGGSEV